MKRKTFLISIVFLICSTLFFACEPKQPKEQYKEKTITANIEADVQQKTYTSDTLIIIAFLGPSTNDGTEIEITLYDQLNQKIAILTKTNKDIAFDAYPYEYIFSITISKNEFPTAQTAKISNYKYVVYEKI